MKGSVMTHGCCPSCRLRFTPAVAAQLDACPGCGEPPLWTDCAEELVGLRLVTADDVMEPAPAAGLPNDRRGR
jgi:hypothetical protein